MSSNAVWEDAHSFSGYSLVRRDRANKLGGVVCAYIKYSISFKVLPDLQDKRFESL